MGYKRVTLHLLMLLSPFLFSCFLCLVSFDNSTIDLVSMFSSLAGEGKGVVTGTLLQRAFEALHLGFAPRDIAQIITLADPEAKGVVSSKNH